MFMMSKTVGTYIQWDLMRSRKKAKESSIEILALRCYRREVSLP